MSTYIDPGLDLKDTHVVVTGGAGLIGSVVVNAFLCAGAKVSSLDISYSTTKKDGSRQDIAVDITSRDSIDNAWKAAVNQFGPVQVCVCLAALDFSVLPQTESIADAEQETWNMILRVNVGGTMAVARQWLRSLREEKTTLKNLSLILTGSEAGQSGSRTCAAYAASKSAIQEGLLHSLRADVPRTVPGARVNAVAPGPVATARFWEETGGAGTKEYWLECQATTAQAKPVPIESVARTIMFLASDRWSGNVHGQAINVNSGKQGSVVWDKSEVS